MLIFTSEQALRISGITKRQLQLWDENGTVRAIREEHHRRHYLPAQVVELWLFAELRRRGIGFARFRRILLYFRKNIPAFSGHTAIYFLTDGIDARLTSEPRAIVDVMLKSKNRPMYLIQIDEAKLWKT
jgi:DNA-binding transcriptional MerR regulator